MDRDRSPLYVDHDLSVGAGQGWEEEPDFPEDDIPLFHPVYSDVYDYQDYALNNYNEVRSGVWATIFVTKYYRQKQYI